MGIEFFRKLSRYIGGMVRALGAVISEQNILEH
jgi:hypothetical protein